MAIKCLGSATFVASLSIVCTAQLLAQSDVAASVVARFTGTWKEDVSRRKVGDMIPLRFQRNAQKEIEEVRGPEARPVVQPVIFDGKPRETASGNTIVWRQADPHTFERVLSKGGVTLTTRRIRLSPDGKTLSEVEESKLTDGRIVVTTVEYQRESGDEQGLVGRWKAVSLKDNNAAEVKYEGWSTNGLKSSGLGGTSVTFMLDGTPAPLVGPGVLQGSMISAKPLNEHTIEFTNSREGVDTGKSVWTVSPDGKTMTATISSAGASSKDATVVVYVKQ